MRIDVALLPAHLSHVLLLGRSAAVFDVLRATTTLATAMANGATRVRVFPSHETLLDAARGEPTALKAGETRCHRAPGFDLGNSPLEYGAHVVADRTIFLSTTNGTRAIHASLAADRIFTGALVNASAVARAMHAAGDDVTLVCAGTQGQVADEDRCGAGAVADALLALDPTASLSDESAECVTLFRDKRADLARFLRTTEGGRNVIDAGLEPDIDSAARLDALDVVPRVQQIENAILIIP